MAELAALAMALTQQQRDTAQESWEPRLFEFWVACVGLIELMKRTLQSVIVIGLAQVSEALRNELLPLKDNQAQVTGALDAKVSEIQNTMSDNMIRFEMGPVVQRRGDRVRRIVVRGLGTLVGVQMQEGPIARVTLFSMNVSKGVVAPAVWPAEEAECRTPASGKRMLCQLSLLREPPQGHCDIVIALHGLGQAGGTDLSLGTCSEIGPKPEDGYKANSVVPCGPTAMTRWFIAKLCTKANACLVWTLRCRAARQMLVVLGCGYFGKESEQKLLRFRKKREMHNAFPTLLLFLQDGISVLSLGMRGTAEDGLVDEAMLAELLAKYEDAGFQGALKQAYVECARKRLGLQAALGPLVLEVQKPVLEKYGLPPDPHGVDLMKHAVQRRICEGSDKLEDLANAARKALGIEPLPERHRTAEAQLAKGADETAAKFSGDAALQEQLREQCLKMVESATAKGTLPPAAAGFLQELLMDDVKSAPIPAALCMFRMAQLGVHVDLLRCRQLPSNVPVLEQAPSADEFFRQYVMKAAPVVLRGAFGAESFAPASSLADLAALRAKCGHRRVLVKSLGFLDGAGRAQFMTDPELKLPFAAYLDAVEACEKDGTAMPFYLGKVPLRAELPELAKEIESAARTPLTDYGGCFGDLLPEGVFTYFGCGRNSTSVHYDCHENLMVCICGTKRLWLYPPGDARYVYPISKDRGASTDFSRSSILPFRTYEELGPEDKLRYPLLRHATVLEVTVRAGDMLYLPACWWHCVEGSDDRNIILNWWFGQHVEKKQASFNAAAKVSDGYA
ncbi:Jmjd7 [Symbiodinium pilosum]|uniref:Jmjd7 protein n=1 Tax=Symbiodinium pilosum TaxID=2952 RepID=A0A812JQ98_SYMPI|nr:Jmjd7 [Symbiodinium pilosum]